MVIVPLCHEISSNKTEISKETEKFKTQLLTGLLEGTFDQKDMKIILKQLLYPEKNEKSNVFDEYEGVLEPIRNYIVILSSTKDNDSVLIKVREKMNNEISNLNRLFKELSNIQQTLDKNTLELLTELNYILHKSNIDFQKCDFITTSRF